MNASAFCLRESLDSARDTIFALATGARRAAIAVIRISGPQAKTILRRLSGREPPARRATLAHLRDPHTGELLDEALVLVFDAARSEIGEDGVELHCHGSPAVVAAVLRVLAAQPGARLAEPGEFARRAFLAGKLDLAQLEGLADLIDAETDWQRRQAQRQLSGAMRAATEPWRAALLGASAQVEAAIDFAEDIDLQDGLHGDLLARTAPVREGLRRELARGAAAERIRDGVQVVIAGPPNAGKSSLLNALARRDAAIVSALAGTTRDPIEVHLDLGGCPVTLVDTAGLRESADDIEQIGVRRAKARAEAADLVLWLGAQTPPAMGDVPIWRIASKCDLDTTRSHDVDVLALSATTGENLLRLVARLTEFAQALAGEAGAGIGARLRHRDAFARALAALERLAADPERPVELLAEDLRVARHALERLIGSVDVEDVLGDIFSRFCIGK